MKLFDELLQKILIGQNPYEDFVNAVVVDPAALPKTTKGRQSVPLSRFTLAAQFPPEHFGAWGSEDPWFAETIQRVKPRVIIEVGSFLGGSAITMGKELAALGEGHDAAIVCVDTWLAEEILWSMPEHREKLKIRCGTPCFYYTFLANIIDRGLQGRVVPLRMPSLAGGRYLQKLGVTAQLIYIDGSHIEGDVIRDLEMYWDRLDPGGAMLLDDYEPGCWMFEGLVRDVDRFAAKLGLKLEREGNKARLWK